MAVTYTASIASGYLTDVLYYNQGQHLVFTGHYSAPSNATGIIETPFYHIDTYYVQDADPTTYAFSVNATGSVTTASANINQSLIFSGMVAGATGYFEIKGW